MFKRRKDSWDGLLSEGDTPIAVFEVPNGRVRLLMTWHRHEPVMMMAANAAISGNEAGETLITPWFDRHDLYALIMLLEEARGRLREEPRPLGWLNWLKAFAATPFLGRTIVQLGRVRCNGHLQVHAAITEVDETRFLTFTFASGPDLAFARLDEQQLKELHVCVRQSLERLRAMQRDSGMLVKDSL
jgi:hypothetical protein